MSPNRTLRQITAAMLIACGVVAASEVWVPQVAVATRVSGGASGPCNSTKATKCNTPAPATLQGRRCTIDYQRCDVGTGTITCRNGTFENDFRCAETAVCVYTTDQFCP